MWDRRPVLGLLAAALVAPVVLAKPRPRIVVIGGGIGGVSLVRELAQDNDLDLTLITGQDKWHSPILSNLTLAGLWPIDSHNNSDSYSYHHHAHTTLLRTRAETIDLDTKEVILAGGSDRIPWDRLVVAPGIDFVPDSVPGWTLNNQTVMPHAWRGGPQVALLCAQLRTMPAGGVFVLIAPPAPYRCPPAPYERASMAAQLFKTMNPTAKIIIADPKAGFSKMDLFQSGWAEHTPGMIDWIGADFGGGRVRVDPQAMTVTIDGEKVKADVCNVIPAMKAGRITDRTGLSDGRWVRVGIHDLATLAHPDVFCVGDALALGTSGTLPKSAFCAQSQAKVCARAMRQSLRDRSPGDQLAPAQFSNSCWSALAPNDAIKVSADYKATPEGTLTRLNGVVSDTGESAQTRQATYHQRIDWYRTLTNQLFKKPPDRPGRDV